MFQHVGNERFIVFYLYWLHMNFEYFPRNICMGALRLRLPKLYSLGHTRMFVSYLNQTCQIGVSTGIESSKVLPCLTALGNTPKVNPQAHCACT